MDVANKTLYFVFLNLYCHTNVYKNYVISKTTIILDIFRIEIIKGGNL